MQEVDCEDPGCLGVQELPPGRARTEEIRELVRRLARQNPRSVELGIM
jgi:hypothetical protein